MGNVISYDDMPYSLEAYMKEIGQYSLITQDEEKILARRIAEGDRESENVLICANLRLVLTIAHDFKQFGLPYLDLIAEGNIGLIKASKMYKSDRGAKFSTYASWWVRHYMQLATYGRTVRIPVSMHRKMSRIKKFEKEIEESTGAPASNQAIADKVGVSARNVSDVKRYGNAIIELDKPLSDNSNETLMNMIQVDKPTPLELMLKAEFKNGLEGMLNKLSKRERYIIVNRYGLGGIERMTLQEISLKEGCTRERIRQVQAAALKKLKRIVLAN